MDVTWGGDGVAPCDSIDRLPDSIVWSDDAMRLVKTHITLLESELDACLKAWEDTYLQKAEAQQDAP